MNNTVVKALIKKEIKENLKDRGSIMPIIFIIFIFSCVLPIIAISVGFDNKFIKVVNGAQYFLESVNISTVPDYIPESSKPTYLLIYNFFLPFFLLIPVMISTLFASTSFVGEKINKTIETLLYTPITDKELIFSKIFSTLIPAIIMTWIGILLYGTITSFASIYIFKKFIFLNITWAFVSTVLVPLITFLTVAIVIKVSEKAQTLKSAQSSTAIIVVPIISIVISQASGILIFNFKVAFIFAAVLLLVDILVFVLVVKGLNREKIISST